jgi:hypothetical protein
VDAHAFLGGAQAGAGDAIAVGGHVAAVTDDDHDLAQRAALGFGLGLLEQQQRAIERVEQRGLAGRVVGRQADLAAQALDRRELAGPTVSPYGRIASWV